MPEAFKHVFSNALIHQMAECFAEHSASFNQQGFIQDATHELDTLELKARSEQIVQALARHLPKDFANSADILVKSLCPMTSPDAVSEAPEHSHLLKSWAIMPMAEYVGIFGQQDFELCLQTLLEMTKRFSSEFAIRHLLIAEQDKTLKALKAHVNDPSEHVRRLISEGTRPRLPWGMQLKAFIKQPEVLLPLLENLKDDPSEYVRRSVANNLNDIAKDHPDWVIRICSKWMQGADKNRLRLIRHACRTLFKQGRPDALALFGFLPPSLNSVTLSLDKSALSVGESVRLDACISSDSAKPQSLMLDYVVYHQKANGTLRPKVFKWKTVELAPKASIKLSKAHSFKKVTTRQYHKGQHKLALLINGQEFSALEFYLEP